MNFPPPIPHLPAPPPPNPLPPEVTLILLLPRNVFASDVELIIPIWKVNSWSTRPLKYLQYLGFAILGHVAPLADESHVVLDNDRLAAQVPLPDTPCTYYFRALYDRIRLADYQVDDASLTGGTTQSRVNFRETLCLRDGETCRATGRGSKRGYQASHIIPHAKGSDYIARVSQHYAENVRDRIDDINDIRNGVNLNTHLHNNQDLLGFLPTPNPILHPDDVLPPPSRLLHQHRVTFHWLANTAVADEVLDSYLNNGRLFDWAPPVDEALGDVPDWLLHFMYGAKIMDHYATDTSKASIQLVTNDIFYPGGKGRPEEERNRLQEVHENDADKKSQTRFNRQSRCQARQQSPKYLGLLDALLGLRIVASGPSKELERQTRFAQVDDWRQSVAQRDDSSRTENFDAA